MEIAANQPNLNLLAFSPAQYNGFGSAPKQIGNESPILL